MTDSPNEDFRIAQLYVRAQGLASDAREQVWTWARLIGRAIEVDERSTYTDDELTERLEGRENMLDWLRQELARMDRYESMCEVIRRAL